MKTITEMQQQIKEMSTKLDEFAQDLSEYNKKDETGQSIDFKQIKIIGSRNPIEDHILKSAEDEVKKQYLTLLVAAIYTASGKTDDAWLLAQRIAFGAQFSGELTELAADATNITEEQLDQFTRSISQKNLSQPLALDVMLAYISCGKNDVPMLEFMAALFELIQCSKQEVKELGELAGIIMEQNEERFLQLIFTNPKILLGKLVMYNTFLSKDTQYVFGDGRSFSKVKNLINWEKENIIIYNLVTSGEKVLVNDFNKEKLVFVNCVFTNIKSDEGYLLNFRDNHGEMEFIDCIFSGISGKHYVIRFSDNCVTFENCKFLDISATDSNGYAVYSKNKTMIKNCSFENIKGNYSIRCGTECKAINSTIKNCSTTIHVSGLTKIE